MIPGQENFIQFYLLHISARLFRKQANVVMGDTYGGSFGFAVNAFNDKLFCKRRTGERRYIAVFAKRKQRRLREQSYAVDPCKHMQHS